MSPIAVIASYPGSGNAWARIMLASYLTNAPVTASETLEDVIPDIHNLVELGRLLPDEDSRPRIVNTHFLPGVEVLQPYRLLTTKVVYIVRNPRDLLVSTARILGIEGAQARHFAKEFLANRGVPLFRELSGGTWPRNVLDWTSSAIMCRQFPSADVLVVRFEDMSADPAATLGQVIDFLDFGPAIEIGRVTRAVANSPLEGMQEAVDASDLGGRGIRSADGRAERPSHLGPDIEGSYRQLLRDDEEFRRCAKHFGYVA